MGRDNLTSVVVRNIYTTFEEICEVLNCALNIPIFRCTLVGLYHT